VTHPATERVPRAARWSEQLQRCAQRAERVQPPPVEGVLTRMIGLTLEAAGCQAAVGDRCDVLASDGSSVEAEVVGFSGDRLYLMPTGDIHGLKPNARVVPRVGAGMAIVGEPLLGRIIDGAGVPLDGQGPLRCDDRIRLTGTAINPLSRQPIASHGRARPTHRPLRGQRRG
jgi:flagellum-specific ATP synthase